LARVGVVILLEFSPTIWPKTFEKEVPPYLASSLVFRNTKVHGTFKILYNLLKLEVTYRLTGVNNLQHEVGFTKQALALIFSSNHTQNTEGAIENLVSFSAVKCKNTRIKICLHECMNSNFFQETSEYGISSVRN